LRIRKPDGTELEADSSERNLDLALIEAGVAIDRRCGGKGICRRCRVQLVEGEFLVKGKPVSGRPDQPVDALSCMTRVVSADATVSVPASSLVEEEGRIHDNFAIQKEFDLSARTRRVHLKVMEATRERPVSDAERVIRELSEQGLPDAILPLDVLRALPAALREDGGRITATVGRLHHHNRVLDVEPGFGSLENLAVAVDIGTTTAVCALVDLQTGSVLARDSRYNQQIRLADDVGSRISLCADPAMLEELHRLIVDETLNPLIRNLCQRTGRRIEHIRRIAVAGNTVMGHLFLGVSPLSMGALPFEPVVRVPGQYRAESLGLGINPRGLVDIVPSISAYVGGDLTADIYVSRLEEHPGLTALIDIGTNGEIVLHRGGEMWAAATAAGPAFEGAGLAHGCRAAAGAIENIVIEGGELVIRTIGDEKPRGICGSAIIDFLAEGVRVGWISETGRYHLDALEAAGVLLRTEDDHGKVTACRIVEGGLTESGRDIYVSEADIAEVLKAKAAIFAGLQTLLATRGATVDDLDCLILAGGFAKFIHLERAKAIGLLPDLPEEKIEVIGNGSLAGAYLTLVDDRACVAYREIIEKPSTVLLNLQPSFQDFYIDGLLLEV